MRRSKYPSLGILDALERWVSDGASMERDRAFEKVSKEWKGSKTLFSKRLYSLHESGLIDYSRVVNSVKISLTEEGSQRVKFMRLEKLTLVDKKRDGLWRVIIFDIPEVDRRARKILRSKLADFECFKLQQSVYVTPYICEKEIEQVADLLGIGQYLLIMRVKSLGGAESRIKGYFWDN